MATKQQIAQAKARAGGNNPIKVTKSGLKKLGGAALLAASFTPVGRAAKIASMAKGKKVTKVLATPKSHVKVVSKNTAPKGTGLETRGARPTRDERIKRARDLKWDKMERNFEANEIMHLTGLRSPRTGRTPLGSQGRKNVKKHLAIDAEATPKSRVIKIDSNKSNLTPSQLERLKAKNKALAFSARGKLQTPTATAARMRNIKK